MATSGFSHLDKVFFPDDGITKGDVIAYYRQIAPTMIPYLQGRPMSMQRFPNGITGKGFYQKEIPAYFPAWIHRASVEIKGQGRLQQQVVCDNAATLEYLAAEACITPHTWLSRVETLDDPDTLIIDLDPPGHDFTLARTTARALRDLFTQVGLVPFVLTTGSRGLHVVAPLVPSTDFDGARAFARDLVTLLARREPDRLTVVSGTEREGDRLFLDYLRNAYGQTSVPPYALRAKPGAPVATPLTWEELDDPHLHSQSFTLRTIFDRLKQRSDPWTGMRRYARSLRGPRLRLDALLAAEPQ